MKNQCDEPILTAINVYPGDDINRKFDKLTLAFSNGRFFDIEFSHGERMINCAVNLSCLSEAIAREHDMKKQT